MSKKAPPQLSPKGEGVRGEDERKTRKTMKTGNNKTINHPSFGGAGRRLRNV